jgi:peptidyl-prolyl cis-trans isomerase C
MKKIIPLLIVSSALVTGCKQEGISSTPTITKSEAVAEVNGKFISKSSFDMMKNQIAQRGQGQPPIPDEKLLDELVRMELLVQEAEKQKLAETPEIVNQLELMKRSMLSQAAVKKYIENNPVSDAELKAEYDKLVLAKGSTEYKARHILVKKEEEANKIIGELNAGAKFEELAKTKSTGPSASGGGDLGWFAPDRMVPPFSEAVIALEDGKYTTTPVQTQFGWHIILREQSREKTPPSLEEVKAKLLPSLQRQKIQSHLESLRNQAKVEMLMPLAEAKPKPDAAATAAPATSTPEPATPPPAPEPEPTKAPEPIPATEAK